MPAGKLLRLARSRERFDRLVGVPTLDCLVNTPTRAAKRDAIELFDSPASTVDNIPALCDSVNSSFLPRLPLISVPNDRCIVV